MKYKVGDKVRVRKDISVQANWGFSEGMEPFIGKVVTIGKLVSPFYDNDECLILEDGGEFVWTEEMFEGLAGDEQTDEADKLKYKVGDKVRVRKDLVIDSSYGGEDFVEEMKSFIGKVVTISRVMDEEYMILEDNGDYAWTEEMLEGVANGLTNTDAIKPNYYQYRGGDVFDMAVYFKLNFPLGNALKYLLRAGHKDPAKKIEDLRKCIQCIQRAIEIEGEKA